MSDATPYPTTPAEVRALLAEGDDVAIRVLIDDANLGARIRAKNRESARCARWDRIDVDFERDVRRIRRSAPGLPATLIAERLMDGYANHDAADPLAALAKRVSRCLAAPRDASLAAVPAMLHSALQHDHSVPVNDRRGGSDRQPRTRNDSLVGTPGAAACDEDE